MSLYISGGDGRMPATEILSIIRVYIQSLDGAYDIVSMAHALRYVYTLLGDRSFSQEALTHWIGQEALQQGLIIHFDQKDPQETKTEKEHAPSCAA